MTEAALFPPLSTALQPVSLVQTVVQCSVCGRVGTYDLVDALTQRSLICDGCLGQLVLYQGRPA